MEQDGFAARREKMNQREGGSRIFQSLQPGWSVLQWDGLAAPLLRVPALLGHGHFKVSSAFLNMRMEL